MRNNDFSPRGGAKKFLYTGVKKDVDEQDDLPWSFGNKNSSPRATANLAGGSGSRFDLDNAWSIKRNVNIGGKGDNADPLAYNTNKSYYSRHGGTSKDKEEPGSGGGPSTSNSTASSSTKTWTLGNTDARRPFSYGFNADQSRPVEKHATPQTITTSNPGFGNYQNTEKSLMNTGSFSSSNKKNTSLVNTSPSHSMSLSNHGNMSLSNHGNRQNPMFNSASHNGSLFGNSTQNSSSTYKSSMFNDNSGFNSGFNKQNKSFW